MHTAVGFPFALSLCETKRLTYQTASKASEPLCAFMCVRQGVTHICLKAICRSYGGQTAQNTLTQNTHHVPGKCSLLCRLLPPDCFHHRTTGLFLHCCSVHAKLSASLIMWTIEKKPIAPSHSTRSYTHPPAPPRASSAANLTQVQHK